MCVYVYTNVTGNWQLPLSLRNSRPTFRSPLANCKAAVRAQLKRALFRSSLFLRPLVLSLRPDKTSNKQYDDGTKLQNLQTSDFTPKPPIQGSGTYSDKAEPVSMLVDHPVVQQRPVWRLLGISAPGSLVEPEASDWIELWLWLWLIFFPDWIRIGLDFNFEDSEQLWTLNSNWLLRLHFSSGFRFRIHTELNQVTCINSKIIIAASRNAWTWSAGMQCKCKIDPTYYSVPPCLDVGDSEIHKCKVKKQNWTWTVNNKMAMEMEMPNLYETLKASVVNKWCCC
jgi:hypothetical protein